MRIRRFRRTDFKAWVRMRTALWPDCFHKESKREMEAILTKRKQAAVFVCEGMDGHLCGFVEVGVRIYADGCDTSPVGYLEGIYVKTGVRRGGIGKNLIKVAEEWACTKGCREMASDAHQTNKISRTVHRKLGYEEYGKLVHFRKKLRRV